MIPFEMIGKWGYLNKDFKNCDKTIFWHGHSFGNGIAKVFLLKEEFIHYDENWIELPSWIPLAQPVEYELNEALFKANFPNFPDTYYYKLNNDARGELEINKGYYALIDSNGDILSIEDRFVEEFGKNYEDHEFDMDDEYMIKLTSLPEDLLDELNNYDYRILNPKKKAIDKPLTEAYKQKIIEESATKKKELLGFAGSGTER